MKQILSVQDLSCVGKCSMTVTLPVLSAMGCQCATLPTAIFSTHTAFADPHRRLLTEDIPAICRHWQSVGVSFDAICIGYLAEPVQIDAVDALVDRFDCHVILDPVMGDYGKQYSGITPAHTDGLRRLCKKADILLPNVTEASLLTGIDYCACADLPYYRALADAVLALGAKSVVLTGISTSSEDIGFLIATSDKEPFVYRTKRYPVSQHGTGDLFCAVLSGGVLSGKSLYDSAALAAAFIERILAACKAPSAFGIDFESHLPWLWERLK